jgi:molybdenum cofactor synthesis domain-containing protein
MAREVVRTAAALIIGNEILSGKIQDQNLSALAHTLRSLGIELARASFVKDTIDVVAGELVELSQVHDVVFTSGGVGPTHDDITIDALATAFDRPVVVDEAVATLIRKAYGDKCTEAHLRMARVPEGARLVSTGDVAWPTVVMHNVWVLPGVPEIFRMKLDVVRDHLRGPAEFASRALYVQIDESDLKPLLDQIVEAHPTVEVGSYPKWFDSSYKTKVTFDAIDQGELLRAFEHLVSLLPAGEPQRTT